MSRGSAGRRRAAALAAFAGVCLSGVLAASPRMAQAAQTAHTAQAAQMAQAAEPAAAGSRLRDCHVPGLRNGVQCGSLQRPLDPDRADRGSLTIEYVVVPALARKKLDDPVFMLAGGPGQSAIGLIPQVMPLFARLNNRRDIVFVDQRGTGRSAPLACKDPEDETLAEQSEPGRQLRLVLACKAELLRRPYLRSEADLGFFSTWIAVRDLDAVRAALGAERIDVVGGSYGTRVALEYARQFPTRLRRSVIDGVAPPDMALPASFSTDNEAAWRALVASCAAEPACARAHPQLGERLAALLKSLPKDVTAVQPMTGRSERFTLTGELVLNAVRGALYAPALAAALPEAVEAAARGEYAPLIGLGSTLQSRKSGRLAIGMHLSVVCAEDMPRMANAADQPGADFGDASAKNYASLCGAWPRGAVPAAFYDIPRSESAVLVLSGGIDPVTPPRHGARVAERLGPKARHVVVANAGHGVMSIGCMRDVIFRFIDAPTDADALAVDAGCAAAIPRPPAFASIGAVAAASPASAAAPVPKAPGSAPSVDRPGAAPSVDRPGSAPSAQRPGSAPAR